MNLTRLVASVGLVACSGASSPSTDSEEGVARPASSADGTPPVPEPQNVEPYFPGATWETTSAWNTAKLEELAAYAESKSTTSLIVLLGGRILLERHFAGATETSTHDVYSVQKSVTSTLVDIARDRGSVSVDDTITSVLGDSPQRELRLPLLAQR